jgi:hypothetical protein
MSMPQTMAEHWSRLHEQGHRFPGHPLARGWPLKFEGSREDYFRMDVPVDLINRIRDPHRVVRSRWPNAVLNQMILRYNFAAKVGWPD